MTVVRGCGLHLLLGQLAVEFGFVEGGEVVVAGHEYFH